MDKQIALLRAVNVGNRPVPMKALSALFTELGAREVVTYIQSGNVVFSPPTKKKLDASTLARAIEARFGFAVPVVLRTHAELAACAAKNPFLLRGEDRKAAHVYFLSAPPRAALAAKLDIPARSPGDEGALVGADLYLGNGMGKSKIAADWVDRVLGVTATARNWNTVEKLVELSRPIR